MIEATDTQPVEILLIENNPVDIRMTKEAFKDYRGPNTLHVVTDGEAAMDFIYRQDGYKNAPRPDLIILDLALPKKLGGEVLKEVKADPKFRSIPIIVLATSDLDDDVMQSYCDYANAFISKPVDFDDFVRAVRGIADFWLVLVKLPTERVRPALA